MCFGPQIQGQITHFFDQDDNIRQGCRWTHRVPCLEGHWVHISVHNILTICLQAVVAHLYYCVQLLSFKSKSWWTIQMIPLSLLSSLRNLQWQWEEIDCKWGESKGHLPYGTLQMPWAIVHHPWWRCCQCDNSPPTVAQTICQHCSPVQTACLHWGEPQNGSS